MRSLLSSMSRSPVIQVNISYYISATGNDANSGLDAAHPITVTKISSLSLNSGDSLLFNRGDTFVIGDISQNITGLKISPYGSGAMPKIFGSTDLSGATWANVGGGVWSTVLGSAPLWIYVNGASIGVAASNTLLAASVSTNIITLSSTAPLSGYASTFVGAKLRIKSTNWILSDEYTVTAYNSGPGNITLDRAPGSIAVGKNLFMYMQQQFLTANTWYYNTSTNTLYVQTLTGSSPSGTDIRIGVYSSFITNQMQINMDNIELLNYHSKVISYTAWSYIHDNLIHDNRGVALFGNGGYNSRIINNIIHHCDLNGIFSFLGSNSFYLSNTIYDVCSGATLNILGFPTGSDVLELGTGTYPNSVTGIEFEAYGLTSMRESNSLIEKNTIYNIGYVGIHLSSSSNCIVNKNYVHDHTGTLFIDGGLIYTAGASAFVNNGSIISNNVLKTGGANSNLYGIYVDNFSSNINVINNSLSNPGDGGGIFVNSGTKNTFIDSNKIIDNVSSIGRGGIGFSETGGFPFTNAGVICTNNQVAMMSAKAALYMQQIFDPFTGGSCDNNNYVQPYAANATVFQFGTLRSLATWKTVYSTDASSTERANYITYSNATNAAQEVKMEINPSDTPESFTVPAGYSDVTGTPFSNPVTIPAWSSLIYLKDTAFP